MEKLVSVVMMMCLVVVVAVKEGAAAVERDLVTGLSYTNQNK